ncbi:MAG: cation-transporting P-type ATPase [Nitrospira sp.]|nr:cation-transporting P-type ATPase [Nitrospira sp.]
MELPKDAPAVKLWHSMPANALALDLRTNLEVGLSADEASRRQEREEF